MRIDTIVFDIDGTLTEKYTGKIPDSIPGVLRQLKQQGIKILLATGRPLFEVHPYIMEVVKPDALICNNGNLIVNAKGQILYQDPYPTELLKAVVSEITEFGIEASLHSLDHNVILKGTSIAEMIERLSGVKAKVRPFEKRDLDSAVYNIVIRTADPQILKKLREGFPQLKVVAINEDFYDVYPKNISKASGIEHILKQFNRSWSKTLAFGDNLNDIEMLQKADTGVVMGDGHPDLFAIKSLEHTLSPQEHGIEKALLKFGLIERENRGFSWSRLKHRFTTTNLRYILPISFFLFISTVYDGMRQKLGVSSWTNLALALILFVYSLYSINKETQD